MANNVFKKKGRNFVATKSVDSNKSDYTKDKLHPESNFYVPRADEYKPRAKDISDPSVRKAKQRKLGLIEENPGVKTEQGEKYKKQLEELTGKDQSQIGKYTEAPGGGTPLARGTKAPSDDWVKEHRKMQPRDPETGQFEYNNANAKGTKYPSRGSKIPMFIKGSDFDDIFNKVSSAEHTIITEEGKVAVARLDMTKGEFLEAVINASESLGFTTRWSIENKKGRHTKEEKEALENGERGKIGGGSFDYNKDLSKAQERAIAASDSDQSKFKGNLENMQLTKAYQAQGKQNEHERTEARKNRDELLNGAWKSGQISDELVNAVKDIYPVKAFETKDPQEVVRGIMNMKDKKTGEKRFNNFEDFRHWTLGNRNKGWL